MTSPNSSATGVLRATGATRAKTALRMLASGRTFAALLALGLSFQSSELWAQSDDADQESDASFRSLLRNAPYEWLRSPNLAVRLRGIERLGQRGLPSDLNRLEAILDDGVQQPEELLGIARALAPHAGLEAPRLALTRILGKAIGLNAGRSKANDSALQGRQGQLLDFARGTAAQALARYGGEAGLQTLASMMRAGGSGGLLASSAIVDVAPDQLDFLLADSPALKTILPELLERLGDQRAFHPLRNLVRRSTAEVRARAAVALARLGHSETIALAQSWTESTHTVLRHAALRILTLTGSSERVAALNRALDADEDRELALSLMLEAPHPGFAKALIAHLPRNAERQTHWIAALARSGAKPAIDKLSKLVQQPGATSEVVYALSRSNSPAAEQALWKATERPSTAASALRALVIRAELFGADAQGHEHQLWQRLERWAVSKNPLEREIGAWGQSVLSAAKAQAWLGSKDPIQVAAAARAGLLHSQQVAPAMAERVFAQTVDPGFPAEVLLQLGALALSDRTAAARVPTDWLRRWILEDASLAPLAARALAARYSEADAELVERLLQSANPIHRSHVCAGLAHAESAKAVGMLARAYSYDTDSGVRRAIVTALGNHSGPTAQRLLKLAATLDPDAGVRSAARLARRGIVPTQFGGGRATAWFSVKGNRLTVAPQAGQRQVVLVHTAAGVSLPLVTDLDGVLPVVGLPAGKLAADVQVSNDSPSRKPRPDTAPAQPSQARLSQP